MENKKQHYLLPLALMACLAIGLFIGRKMSSPEMPVFSNKSYGQDGYRKMQDILTILDTKYVDRINADSLFEQTIGDMLQKLDPHSNYISAKDIALANEQIYGQFAGVGIRFFIIRDTVCVTHVIKDSPSERAGLKAGDKILKVGSSNIAKTKISNEKIMSLLKGPEGTTVAITLLRNNEKIKKSVTRGAIPINSISSAYMINKTTGFIKIDQFSLTTTKEFKTVATTLLNRGMKQLVLDLRNNGGGVLSAATEIADEFLSGNKIIVSTKGKHSSEKRYLSKEVGILEKTKLAVLINENSASASEILAGALQDHDRAVIVGRRSFGKGLVQEDVRLRDGSNVRLTVARYYTPTGRCIQKPFNGNLDEYYHEQSDRYTNGELYAPDSSVFVDSLKFRTPKGKIVYGGGGIMPDVFVPLDTTGSTWYLTELRYSMAFQAFSFDFVKGKRTQWYSPDDFVKTFSVTDGLLEQFTNYCVKQYAVSLNQTELQKSKTRIKEFLKAEIARQLWVENGYYHVINGTDREVLVALKQFN